MTTVVYRVLAMALDGAATLKCEVDKQTFVPRDGDSIDLTGTRGIEAVVQNVNYDPVNKLVTVYAEVNFDRNNHKIDHVVASVTDNGWTLEGDVTYHCDNKPCDNGPCGRRVCDGRGPCGMR